MEGIASAIGDGWSLLMGKVGHSLVREVFQDLVSTDRQACHVLVGLSPVRLVDRAHPTGKLL